MTHDPLTHFHLWLRVLREPKHGTEDQTVFDAAMTKIRWHGTLFGHPVDSDG